MQLLKAFGVAAAMLVSALLPAAAEPCGPSALGVSRTVEIDTSQGPRFGFQYNDQKSFLAEGEVVLTFDDGPLRAYTLPVLEALSAHCTKATFFLVGRMAVADPEMVKEYARRGHTVGTHTWSHANLKTLTPLKARAEIELGFSAVQQAMGKPLAPFFRFPFLSDPKSMVIHAQERQMGVFSIDVDSKDFATRDPGSVHHRIMAGLARPRKGILLFHDIQPSTARALPGLLADLKAKGYRVVHMVPKDQVTTVAEFDAQAQQEMDRRRVRVAAQPMAKRAFTWPAAGSAAESAAARAPASARPVQPRPRRPVASSQKDSGWPANFWR